MSSDTTSDNKTSPEKIEAMAPDGYSLVPDEEVIYAGAVEVVTGVTMLDHGDGNVEQIEATTLIFYGHDDDGEPVTRMAALNQQSYQQLLDKLVVRMLEDMEDEGSDQAMEDEAES